MQNASARAAKKYREDCVEAILCDGQELWLSKLQHMFANDIAIGHTCLLRQ